MKKIIISLLLSIASFCFISLNAQTQFSGWLAAFNTFKTGKKTSIHNDIQWRSSDELKHTQTLLLRGGLNIHVTKQLTVTGGYAYIHNRRVINNISGYAPEHRLWEQLLYSHKLKNIFSSHRLRLEQRFISKSFEQDGELENEGSVYANRLRYFIRNVFPFKRETTFTKGMFAALQNEVFVNFGNTANVNGKFFDQNRLYLAVGYRLHSTFDIEAGYLNQYISGKGTFTNNHIMQLAGYIRL
jgi:hypothetical protein